MSRNLKIKVKVPAVVGNLSVGFDMLGMAIDAFYDEVIVDLNESGSITIESIHGFNDIPRDIENNTATAAMSSLKTHLNDHHGVNIKIYKNIPFEKGLGSSACSAVAGVFAYSHLLGRPLDKLELIPHALVGERVSIPNATNLDNVAPAMLGGCTWSSPTTGEVSRIYVPPGLKVVVCVPHLSINTNQSRRALPTHVTMRDYLHQQSKLARFILGMMKSDFELIRDSISDIVIEPIRSQRITGFNAVKQAAMSENALGCGISGSGPTLFALCENDKIGRRVAESMTSAFMKHGVESDAYVCMVDMEGATIL